MSSSMASAGGQAQLGSPQPRLELDGATIGGDGPVIGRGLVGRAGRRLGRDGARGRERCQGRDGGPAVDALVEGLVAVGQHAPVAAAQAGIGTLLPRVGVDVEELECGPGDSAHRGRLGLQAPQHPGAAWRTR